MVEVLRLVARPELFDPGRSKQSLCLGQVVTKVLKDHSDLNCQSRRLSLDSREPEVEIRETRARDWGPVSCLGQETGLLVDGKIEE